jgi:hypothetical protein
MENPALLPVVIMQRLVIPDHAFVRNLVYLHVESRKLVRA